MSISLRPLARELWLFQTCHLVLELRLRAKVRDVKREPRLKRVVVLASAPGLTITRSVIRPGYEEDALIEPAEPLHLGQLWALRGSYQHHSVTGAQLSRGPHEVFLYSLWVHLLQGGKGVGLGHSDWGCGSPILRSHDLELCFKSVLSGAALR